MVCCQSEKVSFFFFLIIFILVLHISNCKVDELRVYFILTLPIRNLGNLVSQLPTPVPVRVQVHALWHAGWVQIPGEKLHFLSACRLHPSCRVYPHEGAMCTRCGTLESKMPGSGQQVSAGVSGQMQRGCPATGRDWRGQDRREAALRMQSRRGRAVPSHKKWRRGREQSQALGGAERQDDGFGCAAVRHPGDHEGQWQRSTQCLTAGTRQRGGWAAAAVVAGLYAGLHPHLHHRGGHPGQPAGHPVCVPQQEAQERR